MTWFRYYNATFSMYLIKLFCAVYTRLCLVSVNYSSHGLWRLTSKEKEQKIYRMLEFKNTLLLGWIAEV